MTDDAGVNRTYWDSDSDEYQSLHRVQLSTTEPGWGVWQIPEAELRILGDVRGKDVLELGCGAAQWSIALAGRGARPVGLDNSGRQLFHARKLMREGNRRFPLVHASAERPPFADRTFDIVFCDHGGMSFADPYMTVPEASRMLRPGGLLAFNMSSPLLMACWSGRTESVEPRLHSDYFGRRRLEYEELIEYQLPIGEWIRLFRKSGFDVLDLVELRPPVGATTTYEGYVTYEWARRWPAENIWVVRKKMSMPQPSRG
jgi:SAM-dependent methyltransferase